jgi:hypothetical protein
MKEAEEKALILHPTQEIAYNRRINVEAPFRSPQKCGSRQEPK